MNAPKKRILILGAIIHSLRRRSFEALPAVFATPVLEYIHTCTLPGTMYVPVLYSSSMCLFLLMSDFVLTTF